MYELLKSYLQESLENKKGITLYIKGNTVSGYVTRIDTVAVEVKNERSSKILILLSSIDAVELS
jgi:hypothetical protein